jgi:2-hydroxy-3-keto-5-methylthiopentenyl-1-phosphate phosphatase
VVISDVDGTITKSDLLGHIAPAFGIQWAQKGVAQLLTRIQVTHSTCQGGEPEEVGGRGGRGGWR